MPESYYDLPFFYTFDGDDLTDGTSYNNLAVPLENVSDFILRRIVGVPNVASKFRYRDENLRDRMSALYTSPRDILVVPEIRFAPDTQFSFDLGTVTRANVPYAAGGSTPNYLSQIALQGVRRYYGQRVPVTAYRHHDRPYAITQQYTIDWTGRLSPAYTVKANPRQFSFLVDDYDFELQNIEMLLTKPGAAAVPCTGFLKIRLYDCNQQAMSTAPVLDSYVNSANGGNWASIFPVPTVLYPANSIIRFDIESLLVEADMNSTLTVNFIGMRRYPC
jgi:hypothetical protein